MIPVFPDVHHAFHLPLLSYDTLITALRAHHSASHITVTYFFLSFTVYFPYFSASLRTWIFHGSKAGHKSVRALTDTIYFAPNILQRPVLRCHSLSCIRDCPAASSVALSSRVLYKKANPACPNLLMINSSVLKVSYNNTPVQAKPYVCFCCSAILYCSNDTRMQPCGDWSAEAWSQDACIKKWLQSYKS